MLAMTIVLEMLGWSWQDTDQTILQAPPTLSLYHARLEEHVSSGWQKY